MPDYADENFELIRLLAWKYRPKTCNREDIEDCVSTVYLRLKKLTGGVCPQDLPREYSKACVMNYYTDLKRKLRARNTILVGNNEMEQLVDTVNSAQNRPNGNTNLECMLNKREYRAITMLLRLVKNKPDVNPRDIRKLMTVIGSNYRLNDTQCHGIIGRCYEYLELDKGVRRRLKVARSIRFFDEPIDKAGRTWVL